MAAVLMEVDGPGPHPVQVAFEHRTQYEDIYEKALSLFEGIPDSNPAPKVGALRLSLAALDRLATWDQTIGVLPERLGWVFHELDASSFFEQVLQTLEAAGIPAETVDKVIRSVTETDRERDTPIELAPPGE